MSFVSLIGTRTADLKRTATSGDRGPGKTNEILAAPLRLYCGVLIGMWLLMILVGAVERYYFGLDPHHWYPLYFYDAIGDGRFLDFVCFAPSARLFHQPAFFHQTGFSYPAPLAFVLGFFYLFGSGDLPLNIFLGVICFIFVASALVLLRVLHRHGLGRSQAGLVVGVTSLLSFPAMFLFERANVEVVCWLLVALGVAAWWKQRWTVAGVLFGLAASLKLFPVILLALLLSQRKFKALAAGIGTAVAATVVSLWALGPTVKEAAAGINEGLRVFRKINMLQLREREIGFDHSLFSTVKLAFHALHPHATPTESAQALAGWLTIYTLSGAILGLTVYFWKIEYLPRTNQLLALIIVSILLPPVSFEYTLVHLYLPFAAVLIFIARRGSSASQWPGLSLMMVCFAILFAPESYLFLGHLRYAGQFQACVLTVLFIVAIRYPIPDEERDGTPGTPSARPSDVEVFVS